MGSTVKKIAKVAIVAAAAYYGGTALMSSFSAAAPTVGSTALVPTFTECTIEYSRKYSFLDRD